MLRIFVLAMISIMLVGCGIHGKIEQTTTTETIDQINKTPIKVTKKCEATYSNTSWGTADQRGVHGCGAGGDSSGVDNTAMVQIPLGLLQALGAAATVK